MIESSAIAGEAAGMAIENGRGHQAFGVKSMAEAAVAQLFIKQIENWIEMLGG
jgi:hypothetical protein